MRVTLSHKVDLLPAPADCFPPPPLPSAENVSGFFQNWCPVSCLQNLLACLVTHSTVERVNRPSVTTVAKRIKDNDSMHVVGLSRLNVYPWENPIVVQHFYQDVAVRCKKVSGRSAAAPSKNSSSVAPHRCGEHTHIA